MDPAAVLSYGIQAHNIYTAYKRMAPYLRGSKRDKYWNYPVSKYISPLDYRIAKIERNVKATTPELKSYQFQGITTCNANSFNCYYITAQIQQGNDEFERTGNAIKIHGFKVTGAKNSSFLSTFMVLAPNGIAPTASVFTTSSVPQVKIAESDDFKILKYLHNYGSTSQVLTYSRRFKKPLHTKYRATTGNCETSDALYMCLSNNTSTAYNLDWTITVYFTDA